MPVGLEQPNTSYDVFQKLNCHEDSLLTALQCHTQCPGHLFVLAATVSTICLHAWTDWQATCVQWFQPFPVFIL